MYGHRPLPPVIGTEEWYQRWHLDIPSSESESDHMSDVFSDSDSEDNLPKDSVSSYYIFIVEVMLINSGRILFFSDKRIRNKFGIRFLQPR